MYTSYTGDSLSGSSANLTEPLFRDREPSANADGLDGAFASLEVEGGFDADASTMVLSSPESSPRLEYRLEVESETSANVPEPRVELRSSRERERDDSADAPLAARSNEPRGSDPRLPRGVATFELRRDANDGVAAERFGHLYEHRATLR